MRIPQIIRSAVATYSPLVPSKFASAARRSAVMSLKDPPARNPKSSFSSMRGHHGAVRVPDYEVEKRWFVEKLEFRIIQEWPYEDQRLAYLAPPNDDNFHIEILGDGTMPPIAKTKYKDLSDSLRYAGFHHVCLEVDDVD